jgi:hypothetical protein
MPDRSRNRIAAVDANSCLGCFVGGGLRGKWQGRPALEGGPALYEDTDVGMRLLGAAEWHQVERKPMAGYAPAASPPVVVAVKNRGKGRWGGGPAGIGVWKVLIADLCRSPRRVGEEATLSQGQSRRNVRTMRAARYSVCLRGLSSQPVGGKRLPVMGRAGHSQWEFDPGPALSPP